MAAHGGPTAFVGALRSGLAADQRAYLEALPGRGPSAAPIAPAEVTAQDLLGRLRSNLRAAALSRASASGEVDLAIKRAAVIDRLERIAALEAAFGRQDGAPTTPHNVLLDEELDTLERMLRDKLRILTGDAARLPPSAEFNPIRGQIAEVRLELEAIAAEKLDRSTAGPRPLVSLSDVPTASDPERALEAIRAIETAEADVRTARTLLVSVEERLAWSPRDASLQLLRDEIVRSGRVPRQILARLSDSVWARGWPPRRGPPDPSDPRPGSPRPSSSPPGGSPPGDGDGRPASPRAPAGPSDGGGGAAAAVDDVRDAVAAEVQALRERNALQAADAAAQRSTAMEWLNYALGGAESDWASALGVLDDAELERHRATLNEWKAALVRERDASALGEWRGAADLDLVDARLAAIETEIMIRGPPEPPGRGPRGPSQVAQAADLALEQVDAPAYEEFKSFRIEHHRMAEIEARLAVAPDADRPALLAARGEQAARRLEAESRIANQAYERALEAERRAYVAGRGRRGAVEAINARAAKVQLERHSDAARALLARYVDTGLVDAGRASEIRFDASLPGVRATAAEFAPSTPVAAARNGAEVVEIRVGGTVSLSGRRAQLDVLPEALDFERSFPRDGLNSAEAFRRSPMAAPGGVVVDLSLPAEIGERIVAVRYDASLERLVVELPEGPVTIAQPIAPRVARAALAFVLDGRVAAVDIGRFDQRTLLALASEGALPPISQMTGSERELFLNAPNVVQIVRMNPAVGDTAVAADLIAADELIFAALDTEPIVLLRDTRFRGVDMSEAVTRLARDRAATGLRASGLKSVLTLDQMSAAREGTSIVLAPRFDYAIYAVPEQGEPVLFEEISAWFAESDAALRAAAPELDRLAEFAAAAAVFRSALSRPSPAEISGLEYVWDDGAPTPTLICRSPIPSECEKPFYRNLTAPGAITGDIQ